MKYRVEYLTERSEEVIEADHFRDTQDSNWIDFFRQNASGGYERIARIRAAEVARIKEEGVT